MEYEYGSPETLTTLHEQFALQGEILERVNTSALPDKLLLTYSLITGLKGDVRAISLLFAAGLGNQAVMIFRALIEKIVTILYLQVVPEDEFQAFVQYSAQKTYQLARKSVHVDQPGGPIEFRTADFDLSQSPQFKAAVDRFTSASGKSKTRWSNTSIEKKLEAIKAAGTFNPGSIE